MLFACGFGVAFVMWLSTTQAALTTYDGPPSDKHNTIVLTILSQSNPYHAQLAEQLQLDIEEQMLQLRQMVLEPVVHLTHRDFNHVGAWAFLPIIPQLVDLHNSTARWFCFLEDRTSIHLEKLISTMNSYDSTQESWYGFPLLDREPTIIHHFAFFDDPVSFPYPNSASGFAISITLMRRLAARLAAPDGGDLGDFSIDSAHELAMFIWDQGTGPRLHPSPAFCANLDDDGGGGGQFATSDSGGVEDRYGGDADSDSGNQDDGQESRAGIRGSAACAAYPKLFQKCDSVVATADIYFAVKTCGKYHDDRVSVVQRTWGRFADRISYFSDTEDENIPTIVLDVPNSENGHCEKTFAIIKYLARLLKKNSDVEWIVIADDDTILSVSRLQQLLGCYDARDLVALGERYGYRVLHPESETVGAGYNYITGGGGMVFSRPLLAVLAKTRECVCPSLASPDDMYLGICLSRLGVDITHSPLFHQARPDDYSPDYLKSQLSVSFHKHWMVNPIKVYESWFLEEDQDFAQTDHDEL